MTDQEVLAIVVEIDDSYESTEEEKAELARREAKKDKVHEQYMRRRAEGRDANYNKQVARRRAQQREDKRKTRRWEDINAKEGTEDTDPY